MYKWIKNNIKKVTTPLGASGGFLSAEFLYRLASAEASLRPYEAGNIIEKILSIKPDPVLLLILQVGLFIMGGRIGSKVGDKIKNYLENPNENYQFNKFEKLGSISTTFRLPDKTFKYS